MKTETRNPKLWHLIGENHLYLGQNVFLHLQILLLSLIFLFGHACHDCNEIEYRCVNTKKLGNRCLNIKIRQNTSAFLPENLAVPQFHPFTLISLSVSSTL